MNTQKITFGSTDLASRSLAALKRIEVEAFLQRGCHIIADFRAVQSISGSYADEFFGVLAQKLGAEKFIEQIRLVNIQEHCLRVVAECIHIRTKPSQAA